ncbi:MAG: NAD-dependent epimerase/dehydratase family protein [Acidimicrobiales bacterium]
MIGTIAITGATGYLGAAAEARFRGDGWSTVRLVRRPSGTGDRRFELGASVAPQQFQGVDVLLHAAYDMRVVSEEDIRRVNVDGSKLLLDAAAAAGVSRMIVLSSMSAYPGTRQLYGRAKLEIEQIALARGAAVVRPGIVVSDRPGGMAGSLARLVTLPVTPCIAGAGHQFPLDEEDFLKAMSILATTTGVPAQPLGLAQSEPISLADLLRLIARRTGTRPPRLLPVPPALVKGPLLLAERLGLSVPFRSDSLLGLLEPAPSVPGLDVWAELGLTPTVVA